MDKNKYTPVIGLEVHVELKTNSKMFCGCSADYFGKAPNTHTCPVCLGMPGALPVPNQKAIEWCVMIGHALNCEIPLSSKFDRKNYFYPDLAKGYQISQYDEPFAINGWIDVPKSDVIPNLVRDPQQKSNEMLNQVQHDSNKKRIRIRRVHMEEDTAKLLHENGTTLIDFNRSGVPLVEIVTEPDFENAYQVVQYLKKLQQIVRYLGVSNADMEKGDMRLEPNISLRIVRHDKYQLPPYKVEVKNINSFRFVDRAIEFEIKRQAEILDKGETPPQETRGWNETKNATISQRVKEEANDYRYFSEPDIPPIQWQQTQIDGFKLQIPEMPDQKLQRFEKQYGLPIYDAEILTRELEEANFFEAAVKDGVAFNVTPKQIANWLINKKVSLEKLVPADVIRLIIEERKTETIDDTTLEKIIDDVLKANEKPVQDYKKGKTGVLMFLVGQVMKAVKAKPDAQMVRTKLEERLH